VLTSKQVFKNKGRDDLEVEHRPSKLALEYLLVMRQGGNTITLDVYDLKRISRVANKNIKELEDDPGLCERVESALKHLPLAGEKSGP